MPSMYPQMPDALVYFCSLESPACEEVVNRKKVLKGGREPLEGVFIHHTCSLPPEYSSKTLEGQRALLICCDHEYIE